MKSSGTPQTNPAVQLDPDSQYEPALDALLHNRDNPVKILEAR